MRVLHVAESAQGGVGTYLAEMLPYQARRLGIDHVRALLPDRHAAHVSGVDRRSVESWRRRGRSLLALLTLGIALVREVRRFRPTVIHAHSSFAGALVRLIYGWRRVPFRIVYCPHGWGFDRKSAGWKRWLVARVERALSGLCDRIVVISDHERRQGIGAGIAEQRMTLVLNGIADIAPARPARWDDPRIKVLFVGRLDHQKGFDTLLDAVEPLGGRLSVRVIGEAIVGRSGTRRAAGSIETLGWRSLAEVAAEIAAADVVVIPSRWEGFGLVAIEAMRGGRAVVASTVGGLREIVVDGETGRLVSPDMPERLAHVLQQVGRDEWHAMGRAGRARYLARFTADRMNDELIQLYEALGSDIPALYRTVARG
ncbi:glycosyltransferase [Sphingomonas sp. CROZ-RG-20F-R02-07]|uniref:glycosyltransferase n=1 Tax=Sphingomonas sp. CROZ-RG-20F-R02-07 TaxID=2914832 RepID=UPI001F597225|nr:glycosyltransferase [Sphingomonas sp. CROZ-RG-20F-R02-07]